MLETEAEGEVFNISRGTWQMLMHWKQMFDRCYCINSTNYSLKPEKNLDPIFCHRLTANALVHLFTNIRLPGPRAFSYSKWLPSSYSTSIFRKIVQDGRYG